MAQGLTQAYTENPQTPGFTYITTATSIVIRPACQRRCYKERIDYRQHGKRECEIVKTTFTHLRYPTSLIDAKIKRFINNQGIDSRSSESKGDCSKNDEPIIITILFKDQRSAEGMRKQLQFLSNKVGIRLQPAFLSQKNEIINKIINDKIIS